MCHAVRSALRELLAEQDTELVDLGAEYFCLLAEGCHDLLGHLGYEFVRKVAAVAFIEPLEIIEVIQCNCHIFGFHALFELFVKRIAVFQAGDNIGIGDLDGLLPDVRSFLLAVLKLQRKRVVTLF